VPRGMLRDFRRNMPQSAARRRTTNQWDSANHARGQDCICINCICITVKLKNSSTARC